MHLKTSIALALLTLTALFVYGQSPRTNRPTRRPVAAPSATPTPAVEPSTRRVMVKLKDGRSLDADFVQASADQLEVRVAGNRLKIAMEEVAMIVFSSESIAQALAPPTPTPTPELTTATLTMEAGVIYKMGGNQPVGRTNFALLNESLATLIMNSGYRSKYAQIDVISAWGIDRQYPNASNAAVLASIDTAIREHTVYTVTTDFNGRAQFENVQPGAYFLVGIAQTRRGHAIWNVSIELKPGMNSVVLDQNNAASAF